MDSTLSRLKILETHLKPINSDFKNPIGIIGGGIAGLYAALLLEE